MSITGKKRATVRSSKVSENLIEGVPHSIIAVDLKGDITYCNKATEILTGYAKKELIGKHFSRIGWMKNKEASHCLKLFKELLKGKKVVPFEIETRHKDGKSYWVEVHLSKIKVKGKITGFQVDTRDITSHRLAEESMKQKVIQLNSFINNIPDMAWIKDFKSRFIAVNKAFGEMVGMKPETLIGRTCEACFGAKSGKKFREDDQKVMQGRKQVSIEEKIFDSKGNELWLETIKSPIFSESGKVVGTVGIARNVTERRRAEEALQESERRYRLLAENVTDIIWTTDMNMRFTYISPSVAGLRGYTSEEAMAMTLEETLTPASLEVARKVFAEEMSLERKKHKDLHRSRTLELEQRCKDGSTVWTEVTASFLRDQKARPVGILGVARDITDRKRAEEALRESEQTARAILNATTDTVGLLDRNGKILSMNEVGAKRFGRRADELIGTCLYDILPSDLAALRKARCEEVVRSKNPIRFEDERDGRAFDNSLYPVFDAKGKVMAIAVYTRDITERKQMEETLRIERDRLETVTRNIGAGLAIISRDYRTLWANQVLKQIFGEVEGRICYSTYNQRTKICPGCGVRVVFETGQHEVVHEQVGKGIDGKTIWSQIVATPIKDKEGNVIAALEVVVDITKRKQAEEALRESEERYRSLFEDSPISLWEEDFSEVKTFIDGLQAEGVKDFRKYFENHPEAVANCASMVKVIDVNNASLKLFKAKSKEELQRSLVNIFSEDSYHAFKEELMAITRGENTFETEAITQTIKGDKKHVMVRWSMAPGYEKTLSKVLVSIGDITELKRAWEQNLLLETSKALSRTLRLDQVLKIGTEKMVEALRADRCSVVFTDQNMHSLTVKHLNLKDGSSSSTLLDHKISTTNFPEAKESLRRKGYYQVFNTGTDPLPEPGRRYLLRAKVKSALIIPMLIGKKPLGLFNIESIKEVRNFTRDEIGLAQTIANQVAVAVQNALLIEDLKSKHSQIIEQAKTLERQCQEQGVLMNISRALSQTLDLDRILHIAAKEATQALQVDRCAVALAFPEDGYAEIKSIYVKEGKSVSHLLGHKLYPHNFPQAKEMFKKRKVITHPNTYDLPDKSFTKEYLMKEEIKSVLFAPMVHGKKLVGFFILSTTKDFKTFTKEEKRFAQTIADQTAVAIENARLLELVRKSEKNLKTLSAQLINIQEDERKKIAQELHDEVGQTLFAMKMNLDVAKRNLPTSLEKFKDIENRLSDTEHLLSQTIDHIRNLTTELRPSMLDDFGLLPAIKWYIDNFSKRTKIEVSLKTKNLKGRFPSEVETTFYRILQEALTNVAKHAQATEVTILLGRENSYLSLSVEDNGKGFDTKKTTMAKDRMGLFNIKERVKLLNGEFEIHSKPNRGAQLSIKIPLAERRG